MPQTTSRQTSSIMAVFRASSSVHCALSAVSAWEKLSSRMPAAKSSQSRQLSVTGSQLSR